MRNTLSKVETLRTSIEIEAGILFADLDLTLFDGIVIDSSDEELENAPLIAETISLIHKAKALGMRIVMVTRNSLELIERFFGAKPQLRALFDEIIACEVGQKSSPIKESLAKNNIAPQHALFVDDTGGERADVEGNIPGMLALSPESVGKIQLKQIEPETYFTKAKAVREKVIELLKKPFSSNVRIKIKELLESPFLTHADQVLFAT